jgi:hypothetical protein
MSLLFFVGIWLQRQIHKPIQTLWRIIALRFYFD